MILPYTSFHPFLRFHSSLFISPLATPLQDWKTHTHICQQPVRTHSLLPPQPLARALGRNREAHSRVHTSTVCVLCMVLLHPSLCIYMASLPPTPP